MGNSYECTAWSAWDSKTKCTCITCNQICACHCRMTWCLQRCTETLRWPWRDEQQNNGSGADVTKLYNDWSSNTSDKGCMLSNKKFSCLEAQRRTKRDNQKRYEDWRNGVCDEYDGKSCDVWHVERNGLSWLCLARRSELRNVKSLQVENYKWLVMRHGHAPRITTWEPRWNHQQKYALYFACAHTSTAGTRYLVQNDG